MKSIMQEDERCYICRMAVGTEEHHVFQGRNRRASEQDGLKVRLCWECHWKVHNDTQVGGEWMLALKQKGQEAYEKTHSREEFIRRYGRNYL